MSVNDDILELVKKARSSSFCKLNYSVNIDLDCFVDSMLLHTYCNKNNPLDSVSVSNKEWVQRVTPAFQRANDKWSKEMKLKFIENLLSGAKTELMFFRFDETEDAQIIDGLQRTTAILDFIDGRIKPFGYSYDELGKAVKMFRSTIIIKIYTFDDWKSVGSFYIDMNENITHSKKDIQKAKDWFLAEHNIEL
jgi:Protein of unknown function DUF262